MTGALAASGAVLAGSAARTRAHPAAGLLGGGGAKIAGASARIPPIVTHTTSSELRGTGALVVGQANRAPAGGITYRYGRLVSSFVKPFAS